MRCGAGGRCSPLVALYVSSSKLLHQPVNLLGFPREAETFQERPQGGDELLLTEVQLVHVGIHHLLVEPRAVSQKIAYLGLEHAEHTCSLQLRTHSRGHRHRDQGLNVHNRLNCPLLPDSGCLLWREDEEGVQKTQQCREPWAASREGQVQMGQEQFLPVEGHF